MMALARCRKPTVESTQLQRLTLHCRFVLSSIKGVKDRQSKESVDVDKEMENLNKKLHYLETTYNNATQHLEQIFNRGG